jgi:hypothetical protein
MIAEKSLKEYVHRKQVLIREKSQEAINRRSEFELELVDRGIDIEEAHTEDIKAYPRHHAHLLRRFLAYGYGNARMILVAVNPK